jgi:transposase
MLEGLGQGQILLADRGYDSDALCARLTRRGAWGNIKPMPGRVKVATFSAYLYRFRNLVERFFNKLKRFRAVATRFEKHDANYRALVKLAAARIWMRFMSR